MKNLLYIYPHEASFIKSDLEILSNDFNVVKRTGKWSSKFSLPFLLVKQFFYLLFKLKSFDLVVISFGGYWSLLPSIFGKLFRVPVYIILHGTDSVGFDEINYGNLRKSYLKYILKIAYKNATRLLPVSKSLIYTENTYYSDKIIKQGVRTFFPELQTPYTVIPNVFNSDKFTIDNTINRIENRFIAVLGQSQFIFKGGDLIVSVARELPQFEFYLVGLDQPKDLENVPKNVSFLGRVKHNELKKILNTATYYFQLSITEGFGCALCESMLCGCVPIVSSVNILPEIIANTGFVLEKRTEVGLKNLLLDITKKDNINLGVEARKRIKNNYPLSLRRKTFLEVFNSDK